MSAVFGAQVAAFAVVCVVCSPAILFKFGVDWVRERIEARWPGSDRARAASFWIGLLAPLAFSAVLLVAVVILAFRVRELQQRGTAQE